MALARRQLLGAGSLYVGAVWLTYFLIGLGLFNAFSALWSGGNMFGTPTLPVTRALIPLLERFAAIASRRGVDQLHLEVRDGNPAVKLYISAGFQEVGRRHKYYTGQDGQVYDALTLARTTTV
mgnify:CR=1 FL=1